MSTAQLSYEREAPLVVQVPESEMGESIFFAVRKNNTNLNPEEWLTK